ncbi:XrtA/PEP-CTERM system histidine kinase PrsK [Thermaurantiacus sp.]
MTLGLAGADHPIGLVSHLIACLAFLGLAVWLLVQRQQRVFGLLVAGASSIVAGWAGLVALGFAFGFGEVPGISHAETLRTAGWLVVLLLVLQRPWGMDRDLRSGFLVSAGLGFAVALQLVVDSVYPFSSAFDPELANMPAALVEVVTRLVLAISGIVLLHNIHVNSLATRGPSIRFFVVGIAVMFAYDLNLYTLQFLLGELSLVLVELRGAVNALAVPLLLIAFRDEAANRFALSRDAAFSTISFSAIGIYLIFMSLLAHGLRLAGGDWGVVLQVMFLAVTLIGAALVILSPAVRARLKVLIARNFYRYRYDYRSEWLGFLDKLDASEAGASAPQPIRERIIEAVARVLNCPGGLLLEVGEDGSFRLSAQWHWSTFDGDSAAEAFAADSSLVTFMAETGRIIDFDQLRAGGQGGPRNRGHDLACPAALLADRSLWLAVPLPHHGRLSAILLLERSPVVHDLNWEDYDLLRTLGRQAASYLAEAATQMALDEARSFEDFSRRFAFIMHDLKNVVSQLGLVARNAERHIDKPEFRADLLATVQSSVTKMTDLLALMGQQAGRTNSARRASLPATAEVAEPVDLARVVAMVAAALRRAHPAIEVEGIEEQLPVTGDCERLETMLTHIVQNAIDASAPDAPILIALERTARTARLSVTDRGHGMSRRFIREELFKPFRSSKAEGFGIGAYEAREIARAHGGRIEVTSRPGEGSRFVITLPLAAEARAKLART